MGTQHRINTEKLYLVTREKNNTDTEEDILAIYIWLVDLPTFK